METLALPKNAQRKIRRHDPVRRVYDFTDLQVYRRATQAIGLLACHIVLRGKVIDHVAYSLLGILEKVRAMRSCHEVTPLISDGELLAGRCNETQFGNVRTFQQVKGQ